MATRYHKLPSEILNTATTIDLFVIDQILSMQHLKKGNQPMARPEPTQEELLRILKESKGG